jgi:hypothetical protein
VNTMASFSLFRDTEGNLVLIDAQGHRFSGVEPVRIFPLTEPDRWISICDIDANELVCIENMDDLSPQVRQVLEVELKMRVFLPIIQKIIKISTRSEPSEWQVETDRGKTTFTVNDEDDVHRLGGGRMLIIDAYGTRYLIPDVYRLDSASRKSLAYFM